MGTTAWRISRKSRGKKRKARETARLAQVSTLCRVDTPRSRAPAEFRERDIMGSRWYYKQMVALARCMIDGLAAARERFSVCRCGIECRWFVIWNLEAGVVDVKACVREFWVEFFFSGGDWVLRDAWLIQRAGWWFRDMDVIDGLSVYVWRLELSDVIALIDFFCGWVMVFEKVLLEILKVRLFQIPAIFVWEIFFF